MTHIAWKKKCTFNLTRGVRLLPPPDHSTTHSRLSRPKAVLSQAMRKSYTSPWMWISALKTLFPEPALIYTSRWIPRLLAKGIQKQQSYKLLQEPNTNTNTNTEAQIQIQRIKYTHIYIDKYSEWNSNKNTCKYTGPKIEKSNSLKNRIQSKNAEIQKSRACDCKS